MKNTALLILYTFLGFGCTKQNEVPPAQTAAAEPASEARQDLPPLTVDEKAALEEFRRHFRYLSRLGPRNEDAPWELADAADYIARELEGMGLPVERQGYETRNVAAQNLAVTLSGGERGDQVFVVGAHYDSPPGDPGTNAGGTGSAALLTLVSLMKGAPLKRTLRFVFFSMGESPHADGSARGARHYARFLAGTQGAEMRSSDEMGVTKRAETVGVLLLDRLGSFEPNRSSALPLGVNVVTSPGSAVLRGLLLEDLDDELLAVYESELELEGPDSDLLAFHQHGIPGVSLSGTGPDSGPVRDEQLIRVLTQIRRAIGRISGEKPTNDGMLTPLSEQIR